MEGAFRSCLVQSESCLLACYRYIERNPVRANMVRHPREYRWSSYRSNAEGKTDALVAPHGKK
jgi:putative transposase